MVIFLGGVDFVVREVVPVFQPGRGNERCNETIEHVVMQWRVVAGLEVDSSVHEIPNRRNMSTYPVGRVRGVEG